MAHSGFFNAFNDVWLLDGIRTPMVDYCGALGHVSPTDLGIKAARAVLARGGNLNRVAASRLTRGIAH